MDIIIRAQIIDSTHREIIPVIGCTRLITAVLAVAKAARMLEYRPEKIEIYLGANIPKDATEVGAPGTGIVRSPIAITLGSTIGKPAYGLEVLKDLTPEGLREGKEMACRKCIGINLKENVDKLYIKIINSAGSSRSGVIICHEYTYITYVEKNGEVLTDLCTANVFDEEIYGNKDLHLSLSMVHEFATEIPSDEVHFILRTVGSSEKTV